VERKRATQIGILFACCAFGIAIAYWTAETIAVRTGWKDLGRYADRVSMLSDQIEVESSEAISAVTHDNLLFCSDPELAFMRDYVFHAQHIRDLGRTQDGLLYCTTGMGRLDPEVTTEPPDIVSGGTKIRKRISLVLAKPEMGMVLERDGVTIVLRPDLLKSFDESPKHFSALYFDQNQERMLPIDGPPGALTGHDLIVGTRVERDGVLYEPRCSRSRMKCVVAFEAKHDVLAGRRRLFAWSMVLGGLLGLGLGAAVLKLLVSRRSMESQLRRALRKGTLTLAYQPIVSLETGRIVAAEALARWVNEDGKSIRPDIFVALAEQRGFAREITRLVVGFAAEELADVLAGGGFRVSINIAPSDLGEEGFFRHLSHCLAKAKVDPANVVLELTEHSLAHHETAVAAIARLRRMGHRVYIDDFGTGYSNFVSLHKLDVDGLKVDQAFTQMIGTDAGTDSVVPQILDMARQLNLAIVVEGIETEEQAAYFRAAGAGIWGQGWLFGRPVPAAQLRALLAKDGR
jgi:sensor c-di-GMP phosphodiesterase-like protein